MDEIINISVNGNSLTKDSNCAGVQGEANSTKLRITFSENWDEYGKIITFWNALGENPVKVQLSTNLLENIVVNQRVYIVPIPGEAMTEAGENTFTIEGTANNTVKRTVEGKLKVLASRRTDSATDPINSTPDMAAQIREEIDAVRADIAEAAKAADAAVDARNSANEAEAAKESVENMTVSAETLDGSTTATVAKTKVGDSVNLHFGIPKSESGVHIGEKTPTNPDVNVWIDISGGVYIPPSDGSGGARFITIDYGDYSFNAEEIYRESRSGASVWLRGSHNFECEDDMGMLTVETGEFLIPLLNSGFREDHGMFELIFGGADEFGNGIRAEYCLGWELLVRRNTGGGRNWTEEAITEIVNAAIAALPKAEGASF